MKLQKYKEKKRLQNQLYKSKIKEDEERLQNFRKKNADYARNSRALDLIFNQHQVPTVQPSSQQQSTNSSSAYKTLSAKSKAFNKIEKALPKNDDKKREVISALAKRHGIMLAVGLKIAIKKPRKGFQEVVDAVKIFFESDVIGRVNPGIKDAIRIKNSDKSVEYKQTHTLTMTLREAFLEFQKLYPTKIIKLSKFCQLRPIHVRLYSEVKHETCLCCYCENLSLLLSSLSRFMTEKLNNKSLLEKLCCDPEDYECAANDCDQCSSYMEKIENFLLPDTIEKVTNYFQWMKVGNFYQKKEITEETVEDMLTKFDKDFKYFKLHRYIASTQKKKLDDSIKNLAEDEILIICDFAERFITKASREIQRAFFGKQMISLFTSRMHVGQQGSSYVFASDEQSQSKYTVFAYIDKLIEEAKKTTQNIRKIKIFSDGCAMQFKNRFILSNMLNAQGDFGASMEWNFFASSHGKSACDGIGGAIKRNVHKRVLSDDSLVVYSAKDFVEVCLKFTDKIKIYEVTSKEIETRSKKLKPRWEPENKVPTMPGMQSLHFFKCSGRQKVITASVTSLEEISKDFPM